MTTESEAPEGAPQEPEAGRPTEGETGEEDRRVRVDRRNAELAKENKTLRERLDALEAQEQKRSEDKARQNGELEKLLNERDEKLAALEKQNQDLVRSGRRREIRDRILKTVKPEVREDVELQLAGFAERGDLDLFAEDTESEASSFLDKLRKSRPNLFPNDPTPNVAPGGNQQASLGNPQTWADLTPEQQSAMSPEDFGRMFAAGGSRSSRSDRVRKKLTPSS